VHDVPCSREEIEEIFSSADKDGSGQLNIKEFIASSKAVNMVKAAENCSMSKSPGQKRYFTFVKSYLTSQLKKDFTQKGQLRDGIPTI
jgi:hypothetical protein